MLQFLTCGESHGKYLSAILEGMPSGLLLDGEFVNYELSRRQQGFGRGGRQKIEKDEINHKRLCVYLADIGNFLNYLRTICLIT